MKKLIALSFILILVTTGCTSPTQRPAERDLQVAAKQFDTITYDLAVKAKYGAMMNALGVIRTSGDPEERQKAVVTMSDAYSDVEYLLIQAERAQGLLRSGREWVRAQRGIFDVVMQDMKKAQANANAGQPSVTTGNVPLTALDKK